MSRARKIFGAVFAGGRNAAPEPAPQPGPHVVRTPPLLVGLGDSITWGSGAPDAPRTSYIAQAAETLGVPHVNFGVPGAFTDRITLDVARVAAADAIVVLNAGTNDAGVASCDASPDAAVRAVRLKLPHADELFAATRAQLPSARLVVVTVRDLGRAGAYYPNAAAESLTAAVHEWNSRLRTLAAQHGARLLDLERSAEWYVRSEYDPSGIHPTETGTARLARALVAAIRSASWSA